MFLCWRKIRGLYSVLLIFSLLQGLFSVSTVKVIAANQGLYEGDEPGISEDEMATLPRYDEYLSALANKEFASSKIILDGDKFTSYGGETEVLDHYESMPGKSVLTKENGYVEWTFLVEDEGLYNASVMYFPCKGIGGVIVREISIDGKVPFMEAENLEFTRVWIDAGDIKQDKRGNDIRPSQVESPRWLQADLRDSSGYYEEPLAFYLSKGQHTLRLRSKKEPMVLHKITLHKSSDIPSYAQFIKEIETKGYSSAVLPEAIKIQAEEATGKSDKTLYPLNDRTSPASEPYHYQQIRLNTIGADRWKLPGQWIEWELEVPESGLYNIALRWKQSIKSGDMSSRRIYLDGKIPFKEASNLTFKYGTEWRLNALGSGEKATGAKPYLFYLSKGKHTLRMEVTLGEYADIISKVQDSIYQLNTIYRRVMMITGPEPDTLRDYRFDKIIPDVIEEMKVQSDILKAVEKEIEKISGRKGQNTAAIKRLYIQLDYMTSDHESIAYRFGDFKNNIAGLGNWLLASREQPLELDYILVTTPNDKLSGMGKNVFDYIKHYIMQFLSSFSGSYTTIGDVAETQKKVTVWVGSGVTAGRDQAQILKQMINSGFTQKSNIGVDLQLVSMGSLLPATLAGLGPDVALQLSGGEPLNYAFRNAVSDLSGFPDADKVKERFHESALIPFTYRDGLYALPETQSFPMLFYRKDILRELGIKETDLETWDSILQAVLPKIQKNYMTFGMEPNINHFAILLFQQGGKFYKGDGAASDLDSELGVTAFEKYTELYLAYKLPIKFDFANRFRVGEIPLGIIDFTVYNQLSVFAPEIKGLWSFRPVPGTLRKDNSVTREAAGVVAGCVMLSSTKDKNSAWEFMKWWTDTEAQAEFGKELESIMGAAARYPTANREAMRQIDWDGGVREKLLSQWQHIRAIPEVPGGYFTPRHFEFAFRNIVNKNEDIRETLYTAVKQINLEVKSKRKEFNLPE